MDISCNFCIIFTERNAVADTEWLLCLICKGKTRNSIRDKHFGRIYDFSLCICCHGNPDISLTEMMEDFASGRDGRQHILAYLRWWLCRRGIL